MQKRINHQLSKRVLKIYLSFYRAFFPPIGKQKITLSMVTHNEGNRYLVEVLSRVSPCIDQAVIVDDNSTDNTIEVINKVLSGKKVIIHRNTTNLFQTNESELRKLLWTHTIAAKPEWILSLDADELIEDGYESELSKLVDSKGFDYFKFRLYDMWNDPFHYREDNFWQAHNTYRTFLFRYYPFFPYHWNSNKLHCGRVPDNLMLFKGSKSDIRIKHLGWMKFEDRQQKLARYLSLDQDGKFGNKQQYLSIMDENPHLMDWS